MLSQVSVILPTGGVVMSTGGGMDIPEGVGIPEGGDGYVYISSRTWDLRYPPPGTDT